MSKLFDETVRAVWDALDYWHYDLTDEEDSYEMLVESLKKGAFNVSDLEDTLRYEVLEPEQRERLLVAVAFVKALYDSDAA